MIAILFVSLYTANLAAIFTSQRLEHPIESSKDLSEQTKIKYGLIKGGSTEAFFRVINKFRQQLKNIFIIIIFKRNHQ